MIKKIIIFACIFMAMPLHAETLKQGYTGCHTRSDYRKMNSLVTKKDNDGYKLMLTSDKCFITKDGIKISVLINTWSGSKKVRANIDDQSLDFWIPKEAVLK